MRTCRLPLTITRAEFICSGLTALPRAQDSDRVVPVYQEPRHRQVFVSGATRILHLQVHPGDTTLFHTHREPILYVTLQTTETRNQVLGGDWSQPQNPFPFTAPPSGLMSVTTYAQQPVTHRLHNAGTSMLELIAVLNGSAGDETQSSGNGFTTPPELTNRWFRTYRFTVPPGQPGVTHTHNAPVTLVQTSDGRAIGSGTRTFGFNAPAAWGYFDAREIHTVRNTGSSAVEFVEVEIRQPPL
jgi:hypothetical protein